MHAEYFYKQIEKLGKLVTDLEAASNSTIDVQQLRALADSFETSSYCYSDYVQEILADYNKFIAAHDTDLKLYIINALAQKITCLLKFIRLQRSKYFAKLPAKDNILNPKRQQLVRDLQSKQQWLIKLAQQLDQRINKLKFNNQDNNQEQLLKLLKKRGELDKELFSVNEQLNIEAKIYLIKKYLYIS